MFSFVDLRETFGSQPPGLGPLLARIDVGKGQEALFAHQIPELLKQLSRDARVESITASNAIEGIVVDHRQAERIAKGSSRFRNRNEREFAGYRDAMDELINAEVHEQLTVTFALHLHRLLFSYSGGRGGYLKVDQNLIVSGESGRREVLFTPPAPEQTEFMLTELFARYDEAKRQEFAHPIVLLAAFILDFLSIHPVADGNGRLARLLTTHELLAENYGVARFISVEQRIYRTKNSYYAALRESSQGWHDSKHDIWPWTFYLARIIADAYEDFKQQVLAGQGSTSNKRDRVRLYILEHAPKEFTRRDVERALPDISLATIRVIFDELRREKKIRSEGSGPGTRWRRL